MRDFIIDELYFMIWFGDDEMLYPMPDAVVYVGRDVDRDEVTRDTWCFQDVESYCRYGRYPNAESDPSEPAEDRVDVRLYALREAELHQIADAEQLSGILQASARKRTEPRS